MQTVIGLGKAGCNIANCLKEYSEYNVLNIDVGLKKTKSTFGLKKQDSVELYEKNVPKTINKFLEKVDSETLFITSCGNVSAASLNILEKIKDKTKVTLMYIIPEKEGLSDSQKLQNNLLFNVFQEYARSALLEKIILLDNQLISDIIGPVPILKYWDSINQMIASNYHMINVFEHSMPVFTTFTSRINTARISSIGFNKFDEEEKCFFSLDIPREKRYYYAIPHSVLEQDPMLMNKIKEQVKKSIEHDRMKVGYAVYSTEYDQSYIYCESNSSLIQKLVS
mgnify:CR=1 FL=1